MATPTRRRTVWRLATLSSQLTMPDRATQSLDHILRSGDYEPLADVPILDEHREFNRKGELIRSFGQKELQEICDRCNKREQATGDLSPFGPGHTFDDMFDKDGKLIYKAKEEDQPPVWGYLRNFRVSRFGPAKKLGIIADFYVKRRLKNAKGEIVDGVGQVREFPRRSIELWANDKLIDWVALLRRTPQRDLGLLAYSREFDPAHPRVALWHASDADALFRDQKQATPVAAALSAAGKLRYAMEDQMPDLQDPTMPPDAAAQPPDPNSDQLTPEEEKTAERYWKHYQKKYAASFGSPTNAAPPGMGASAGMPMPDDDKDPTKMGKPGTPDRFAKLEADNARLQAELDRERRLKTFRGELEKFQAQGFQFDLEEELADVADMTPDKFGKHCERIQRNYACGPVGGPIIKGEVPSHGEMSEARAEKAIQYMRRSGCKWDEAVEKTK